MKVQQIKFRLLALSLLGLGMTACDTNLELVQSIDEEFTGISSIEIESSFLDVNYQGIESGTSVHFLGALESNKAGKYSIEYSVDQDKLIIKVDKNGISGSGNSRGYINLTGPVLMDLVLDAGSGNIKINHVTSDDFVFRGGSGNLELGYINAPEINLQLSSGRINAYELAGDVELEISSGNASITNLDGNINAVGSSGKFSFEKINGIVNSSLNSGNGDLNHVQELGRLKISSGNYTVDNSYLGANTKFEGSSGNFDIQTASDLSDFNFDMKTSSGNLKVGESTSSGSLKIDNGSPYTVSGIVSSGNIRIRN